MERRWPQMTRRGTQKDNGGLFMPIAAKCEHGREPPTCLVIVHLRSSALHLRSSAFPALVKRAARGGPCTQPKRKGYSSGTISSATMLMILISGFTAGPAVSL